MLIFEGKLSIELLQILLLTYVALYIIWRMVVYKKKTKTKKVKMSHFLKRDA